MGSTTTKGYPYPVGTDRVMDGDDAIKALAEAIDSDALVSKATTLGQTLTGATANNVSWNAASPDGCALTKPNAYTFAISVKGLYVVTGFAFTTGFQATGSRSYMQLQLAGQGAQPLTSRVSFASENTSAPTLVALLVPGDTIVFQCYPNVGTSIAASTGVLTVTRLGRTV